MDASTAARSWLLRRTPSSCSSSSFLLVSDEEDDQLCLADDDDDDQKSCADSRGESSDSNGHYGGGKHEEDYDNGVFSVDYPFESDIHHANNLFSATIFEDECEHLSDTSYENSIDDVLSIASSQDDPPGSEPSVSPTSSQTKTITKDKRSNPSHATFPGNIPPIVAHSIFSYLDQSSLHSSLTVSKPWFCFAVKHLYRDPFHSDATGRRGPDGHAPKPWLHPVQERLLVRLLLRSIFCPSEPGEKTVLVSEEVSGLAGSCRVVDKDGVEIRTTVNYMSFLEVLDWAPWGRYLDFWETVHVGCIAACESDLASPFRFSFHTILDWFVENPNAKTLVLHPDTNLPCDIANLLPSWTTLCFDQTPPTSYYKKDTERTSYREVPEELRRSHDYYTNFNYARLLHGLLELEGKGMDTLDRERVKGIRHLQLPPDFYFMGDYKDEAATLLQIVQKPLSLDVSACTNWAFLSIELGNENLQELVRFVSLGNQQESFSFQGFLRRCPRLREIEMVVRNAGEVDFGSHTTQVVLSDNDWWFELQSRQRSTQRALGDPLAIEDVWTLSPALSTPPALTVAKLYALNTHELHLILSLIKLEFSNSLRELKLGLVPPQRRTNLHSTPEPHRTDFYLGSASFTMPQLVDLYLHLSGHTHFLGEDPFDGCPRLQRLILVSDGETRRSTHVWRAPLSLRELLLDGHTIRQMFDLGSLARLSRLESLALHDDGSGHPPLLWMPQMFLAELGTLQLSGTGAKSFRFDWLQFLPSLKVLEVNGLEYSSILKAYVNICDVAAELDNKSFSLPQGLLICKFTIINMECPYDFEDSILHLFMESETQPISPSDPVGEPDLDTLPERPPLNRDLEEQIARMERHSPSADYRLLSVLREFCPGVRTLSVNIEGCTCTTRPSLWPYSPPGSQTVDHPLELEWRTLVALNGFLPELTRFRTVSFALNTAKNVLLLRHGFVRKPDFLGMDKSNNINQGKCVFKLGEVDYMWTA
ncbi:hypothetical protein BC939DRAFT_468599 [Gamsiella multidivaricata]|uniref:uncharacterized protein n=1 Tax=Gamsiella multidivaricata TaxID=101098 RepID=UPI00221F1A60|nr:uncharacterized protein BC939DRAFT_468599 [Gamsiella multidivaricata]KAG0369557.1 hypothetical protein BGZ54_009618 [Gamsiella multidivaricata]KAI7816560.1 hypothetical protein BC939DRAFT_468599 [Gamsiella multidivaricata]